MAGMSNPSIGASAGCTYSIQKFLQYLCRRPIKTAATEVPIEGNLLIRYPTAKQVVHVRYPGPSVSGGVPAKAADKQGAGTHAGRDRVTSRVQ